MLSSSKDESSQGPPSSLVTLSTRRDLKERTNALQVQQKSQCSQFQPSLTGLQDFKGSYYTLKVKEKEKSIQL